eukprot:4183583-Pyramimonas_sp.AAC.1
MPREAQVGGHPSRGRRGAPGAPKWRGKPGRAQHSRSGAGLAGAVGDSWVAPCSRVRKRIM